MNIKAKVLSQLYNRNEALKKEKSNTVKGGRDLALHIERYFNSVLYLL